GGLAVRVRIEAGRGGLGFRCFEGFGFHGNGLWFDALGFGRGAVAHLRRRGGSVVPPTVVLDRVGGGFSDGGEGGLRAVEAVHPAARDHRTSVGRHDRQRDAGGRRRNGAVS